MPTNESTSTQSPEPKWKTAKHRYIRERIDPLPVKLTTDELLSYGQRLAQARIDMATHLAKAESIKKDLKAEESKIEAEWSRIATIVSNKSEFRDVRVDVIHDFETEEEVHYRQDTAEVVSRRPLTLDELQVTIDEAIDRAKFIRQEEPKKPTAEVVAAVTEQPVSTRISRAIEHGVERLDKEESGEEPSTATKPRRRVRIVDAQD